MKAKRIGADEALRVVTEAGASPTMIAPTPIVQPAAPVEPKGRAPRAPKTVQTNFASTETLARALAKEAEQAGSVRRFIARVLAERGHDIPDADLNPQAGGRRRYE